MFKSRSKLFKFLSKYAWMNNKWNGHSGIMNKMIMYSENKIFEFPISFLLDHQHQISPQKVKKYLLSYKMFWHIFNIIKKRNLFLLHTEWYFNCIKMLINKHTFATCKHIYWILKICHYIFIFFFFENNMDSSSAVMVHWIISWKMQTKIKWTQIIVSVLIFKLS